MGVGVGSDAGGVVDMGDSWGGGETCTRSGCPGTLSGQTGTKIGN